MQRRFIVLFLSLFLFGGCQSPPTKISSEVNSYLHLGAVVLDTRDPKDFGVSRYPGSINVQADHFQDPDRFRLARRFALYGINPEVPVIIVGTASGDLTDAEKMKSILVGLGVAKVVVTPSQKIPMRIATDDFRPQAVPIWKPIE